MIRKQKKAKRAIRRTKTKFESTFCEEKVQQIYRAAKMAAGGDTVKEAANRERIDQLLGRGSHLSLLLHYSRAFLRGDSLAGNRLLSLLNFLVQRIEATQEGARPEENQTQAKQSGSQGPPGGTPGSPGGFRGRHHN